MLRTKIAWAMTGFMLLLLLISFGTTWFVARQEIVDSRFDVLQQALNLLEEDVRNSDAVLSLHEDSVVLERQENGEWGIIGGGVPDGTTFPINYGEPALIDDWFVVATTDGLAFGFQDRAVSDTIQALATIFLVMFFLAVLLTFLGTWWILRQGLLPLRRLTETMERITESGKLETIAVDDGKDEVTTLSHGFNHMIERVEGTMEQQRRFVADVSHELKTPLTVIEGYAKLLQRWGQEDESVRAEAIDHILTESRQMRNDLIEPMLELNRFASLEQVDQEDIDLAELGEVLTERFLRSHGVHVPIKADGSWYGHRESLQRILVILMDNSLKYAEETSLHLTSNRVEVRDRGPILTEEIRARLFDRFYRLDEARDRSGSGLGLAIAKEVADLNGWTIGSKPNDPDGSVFFLTR
ncbi:histidine kinase dimerization/phospho-acceptor domain-containing protein [Exiguobacterium aestuarii]|uniref:histidine kinase n=1 Tax=Exiguobacterium aestuarii TaxID=273527 RepID=A0ABW2PH11_9BACL|nr:MULTISPECIES: HAMP domain-containing sensor histidine kinase [Exiguobacterium]MCT4784995.1 HAMP domain-containing histidine kinase [Exiguobacterium aestuarii]